MMTATHFTDPVKDPGRALGDPGLSGPEDLDLLFVGGGLSNCLAAFTLSVLRPDCRFLIVERAERLGGNHTWSFHETDVDAATLARLAPFITHHWDAQQVRFPTHSREIGIPYYTVTSERLDHVMRSRLGDRIRLSVAVQEVTPTRVTLEGGAQVTAKAVIDGRGLSSRPACPVAYQKFLGEEVRLTRPHGLTAPVIMDATVPQDDGYRFFYLLPFTDDTLLIEDTRYSDTAPFDAAAYQGEVRAYAARQGWEIAQTLRTESGVLPIVLGGDLAEVWPEDQAGQPRLGLRAGLFHPVTGYSFPEAADVAVRMARAQDLSAPALAAMLRAHAVRRWDDGGYLRLLNRMMFLGGEPAQRYIILQRFYQLSQALIARFYRGHLTWADKLRILVGEPPIPILAALKSLPESQARAWTAARDGTAS